MAGSLRNGPSDPLLLVPPCLLQYGVGPSTHLQQMEYSRSFRYSEAVASASGAFSHSLLHCSPWGSADTRAEAQARESGWQQTGVSLEAEHCTASLQMRPPSSLGGTPARTPAELSFDLRPHKQSHYIWGLSPAVDN